MKACFIASAGGHWEELMCIKEIAAEYTSVFVTEEGGQAKESCFKEIHVFPKINRHEKNFLWKFMKLLVFSAKIMIKERPDIIVTTGALIAFPFCVYGKLMKAKIIYIESFARVHSKSLTGRLVYPIADLFLVQWESLLEFYPKAKYVGGIF